MAQVANLETRLADATLAMFEKYLGSLFTKARNRDERRFQATKRDVAKVLLLFHRTIAALKQAKETGEDGVAVVDREVGMMRLDGALPIIESVAEVADQEILVTAAERYTVLRRFSPRFLEAFRFQSSTLGLSRMADASRGLGYHHLINVAQWHISDDNYVAARAAIINAHHRHPMAAIWDDGTTSSSDGQYFRAGGRAGPGAPSTPNTASTPAWSSIPMCPDNTGRSIPR